MTLTEKQKTHLLDPRLHNEQHGEFIRKWVHDNHAPQHIVHILHTLATTPIKETKKFVFYRDEIYTMPTHTEIYKKTKKGWILSHKIKYNP